MTLYCCIYNYNKEIVLLEVTIISQINCKINCIQQFNPSKII